jgi:hypothetical protein
MKNVSLCHWNAFANPPISWVGTLDQIMQKCDLPPLCGPIVYIATDYSGTQRESRYLVICALVADLYNSGAWETRRQRLRRDLLRDGRRISFKALSDRYRAFVLEPFLNAAGHIEGLLSCFLLDKNIARLITAPPTLEQFADRLGIKGKWTDKQFETMMRVVTFVSILIGAMGKDGQNMYWISDEDEIFANPIKHADVATVMSRLGKIFIRHKPGELGVGTTTIDPGDRLEEDLVAVADLASGALAEVVSNLSESPKWLMPKKMVHLPELKLKTEWIVSWLASPKPLLKHVVIVFDKGKHSDLTMRRLELKPSQIVI